MILGPVCFNYHLSKNRAGTNIMALNLVPAWLKLSFIKEQEKIF